MRSKAGFPEYSESLTGHSLGQNLSLYAHCIPLLSYKPNGVLVARSPISNTAPHHNQFAERSHWSLWHAWKVNSHNQVLLCTRSIGLSLWPESVRSSLGQFTKSKAGSWLDEYPWKSSTQADCWLNYSGSNSSPLLIIVFPRAPASITRLSGCHYQNFTVHSMLAPKDPLGKSTAGSQLSEWLQHPLFLGSLCRTAHAISRLAFPATR